MSCFFTLQPPTFPRPLYLYIYFLNAIKGAFSLRLEGKGLLGSTASDAQLTFDFCDEALCYLVCYYCWRFYYYQEDHSSIPNIVQRLAEMFAKFPQIIHDFSSEVILNYIINT